MAFIAIGVATEVEGGNGDKWVEEWKKDRAVEGGGGAGRGLGEGGKGDKRVEE